MSGLPYSPPPRLARPTDHRTTPSSQWRMQGGCLLHTAFAPDQICQRHTHGAFPLHGNARVINNAETFASHHVTTTAHWNHQVGMPPLKRKAKAWPCEKVGRRYGRSGEVKGQCGRRKGPSSASASRDDWPEWEVAAEKEICNLIAHGTFDLVERN